MPVALPLVTRREIAREFRPAGAVREQSAIRRLRAEHALSDGVSVGARREAGRLGGRLHVYSALKRDAARALRQGNPGLATRISKAAEGLERSLEAQRLAGALARAGTMATTAQLAQALSAASLARDVAAFQVKHDKAMEKLGLGGTSTRLIGRIASITDAGAMLTLIGMPNQVAVPRSVLEDVGLGQVGAAISAVWETLPGGQTLLTVEPAIDGPELNDLGEPLVDVYGTPWGRILVDADALKVTGEPTISIPAGIPHVA